MEITINDDAFIDLIHAVTADELASLDSRIDDLESGGGYADEDDLDELDRRLTDAMGDCEGQVSEIDDRMDALETRIEEVAEPSDEITELTTQVNELEWQVELMRDAIDGLAKRTNYLMARTLRARTMRVLNHINQFASRVHWHSPFLR